MLASEMSKTGCKSEFFRRLWKFFKHALHSNSLHFWHQCVATLLSPILLQGSQLYLSFFSFDLVFAIMENIKWLNGIVVAHLSIGVAESAGTGANMRHTGQIIDGWVLSLVFTVDSIFFLTSYYLLRSRSCQLMPFLSICYFRFTINGDHFISCYQTFSIQSCRSRLAG